MEVPVKLVRGALMTIVLENDGDWERGKTILYREHRARIAGFLGIDGAALSEDMARVWGRSTP